ncbi:MAG: hypothetical protein ACRDK9_02210 [Solirubrobacterales bacterium]
MGLALLAWALFGREPEWLDLVLGLVAAPAVVTAVLAVRATCSPAGRLSATGPLAHFATVAAGVALILIPVTAGPALLFFGASMLVAAAVANGGCEVTAISNVALRRDDQVGCALFAPIDVAEQGRAAAHG